MNISNTLSCCYLKLLCIQQQTWKVGGGGKGQRFHQIVSNNPAICLRQEKSENDSAVTADATLFLLQSISNCTSEGVSRSTLQIHKVMCESFAVDSTVLQNSLLSSSIKNAAFVFEGKKSIFIRNIYLCTTWPTTSTAKGKRVPCMPLRYRGGSKGMAPLKESGPWKTSDVLPACRGGGGRTATSFKHSSGNMLSRPNICQLTFRSVSAHNLPSKVKG